MKNKNVGFLVIGIALIMGILVLLFNSGLKNIVSQTCAHGSECTMYDTVTIQTYVGLGLTAFIFIIGLFLVFSKPEEKIVIRKIKEKKKRLNMDGLDKDDKRVIELLQKENGGMFQRTLMEKLEIGKVKMTRLLDKLEAKQLVERKRRGMNNIVILKQ